MAAMAAFRTVWTALVGIYEETLVLVGGNVAALLLNLPLGLLLFALGLVVLPSGEDSNPQWLIAAIAWVGLFLPTPGNLALAGLARDAAGPDVPRFAAFKAGLRDHWSLALRCSLISLVVLAVLVWNVWFYTNVGTGWVRFVSFVWLYATLFWLSLHIYLAPLAVHVAGPRLFDLYRRAGLVALGHPGYSLLLLVLLLIVGFASIVFLPVYVLAAGAFINLAQAHALREIRRRHGDLVVEPEEEVSRL
jgi:uncharacterized membrane protein YesL